MVQWLRRLFRFTSNDAAHGKAVETSVTPPALAMAPSAAAALEDLAPPQAAAMPAIASPAMENPAATALVSSGVSWLMREDVNANFTGWLFSRSDYSDLQSSLVEQSILATLQQILDTPQSGAQLVRRMPGVIPQLLQSLRSDDFSGAELSRKISHDVVLVAEVVRLANSSRYAQLEPITSIEHAVMVLGQNGLRHLITTVAFRPIIDVKSGHFTRSIAPRIWDHSEHCAIASRLLAQQAGLNGFDAFLAGLVQNVGLIVSLRIMDQSAEGGEALGSAHFCNELIGKARKLSCSIGREWNFPQEVITAIDEQAIVQRHVALSTVGRNLSMADYLSKLNLLIRAGRQREDASCTDGLSVSELACYTELKVLTAPTPD